MVVIGAIEPLAPGTIAFVIPLVFAMAPIGAASFAPAAVAIVVSEIFGLRSVFYFFAVGGVLGLILDQVIDFHDSAELLDRAHVLFPAAGLAGAFVYWLIAGRLAGSTEPSRSPTASGSGSA